MPGPTQPSVRLVMETPYEGGIKEWSNRWFFNGGNWANEAEFEVVADWLHDELQSGYITPRTNFKFATGTNPGSDVPVYEKTYTDAGTYDPGTNWPAPLECVALVRFSTDQRTSKNHPIYLFKYMHDAYIDALATPEELKHGQQATLQSRMDALVAGISTSTGTRKLCGPRGAIAQAALVEEYLSHRDFPA